MRLPGISAISLLAAVLVAVFTISDVLQMPDDAFGSSWTAPTYDYDGSAVSRTPSTNLRVDGTGTRPSPRPLAWLSVSAKSRFLATKAGEGATRLLGPGTSFGSKIEGQLAGRGWTKRLVQSTIDDPARTVATRDTRFLPGGGRMDDPATGYISRRGGYVIRNDQTGDIVQVSKRTDPNWRAPWDR